MVVGLDIFQEHFAEFGDSYILIGGVASYLVMDDAGVDFRATKDLDIVLCLEALDDGFGQKFWEFIKAGDYKNQEKSTGKKIFYRFAKPGNRSFPAMLELFSRHPDIQVFGNDNHLAPIPVGQDVSSLSAILLEENYYDFLHQCKREIHGISVVGEEGLIPLKARAWLDLSERRNNGESVDSRAIRKHRNDIFRLFEILSPDLSIVLTKPIQEDVKKFLAAIEEEEKGDESLRSLGIKGITIQELVERLRGVYNI